MEDIREEIDFHMAMEEAEGRGTREARLTFGNPTRIKEEVREMRIAASLESVLQDGRYGLRQLRKSPALTGAIVLSLAIGLGANSAIFTLVDAALLKPLPVKDPDRLVLLEWSSVGRYAPVGRIQGPPKIVDGGRTQIPAVSEAIYRGLAAKDSSFASVLGFSNRLPMAVSDGSSVSEIGVQYVSANFFTALGLSPALGRTFFEDEDRRGETPAVVISHRYWRGHLGADPNIIGRGIRINNAPARIIGVAPPGFFGLAIGEWVDAYALLSARAALEPTRVARPPTGGENADWWVRLGARLRPGLSASSAMAQAEGIFRNLAAETTGTEPEPRLRLVLEPGERGYNILGPTDRQGPALWILMLLTGALMLIVCANVANLLLSRSVAQHRESAVRLALGAPRSRLFRQHLMTSGVLAALGGLMGLGLGYALARAIHSVFQTGLDPGSTFTLDPDWRVLGYTLFLSVVTALAFGMAPAIRAAKSDLDDVLRSHARGVVGGRLRLPKLLVSIQVALTFAAVLAAGLLGRSLGYLNSVNLGFEARDLAFATINPYQAGYTQAQVGPYLNQVRQSIAAIPGVTDVAVSDMRALAGGDRGTWVTVPGGPSNRLPDGSPNPAALVNLAMGSAELAQTLGVRILAGRSLEPTDRPRSPVAVVDQRFAQHFLNGSNPVGNHFTIFGQNVEIVGVAVDARFLDLREETTPTVYLPYDPAQFLPGEIHFAIRSSLGADQLAESTRQAVASIDRAVPLTDFQTQTILIDRTLRTERLLAFLSGGFGIIALILAAIGLGGLLAYAVARRTNEIGVRMALGAAHTDVFGMILRESAWMVGIGLVLGVPLAYGASRLLQGSLYGLKPIDPITTSLALGVLSVVALAAAWFPARRASRVDPLVALREE